MFCHSPLRAVPELWRWGQASAAAEGHSGSQPWSPANGVLCSHSKKQREAQKKPESQVFLLFLKFELLCDATVKLSSHLQPVAVRCPSCWVAGKCRGSDCLYWLARHERVRDPQHCHLKRAGNPNWPVIKCLRLYKAAPGETAFLEWDARGGKLSIILVWWGVSKRATKVAY